MAALNSSKRSPSVPLLRPRASPSPAIDPDSGASMPSLALSPSQPLLSPLTNSSLSRDLPHESPQPTLVHTLHQEQSSVLSVAADARHIFSGSQNRDICVWSRSTLKLKTKLLGHEGSVLALEYAEDKKWLFSSSGDSTVRVWCTVTLVPLYIIHPYLDSDSGDIFSLTYSPALQTVYFGCQNTSLQWFNFGHQDSPPLDDDSAPRRAHKFFDSYPRYQRRPADLMATNGVMTPPDHGGSTRPRAVFHVPQGNVVDSAHYGYLYTMSLMPDPNNNDKLYLVTGSGDEAVKLWNISNLAPQLIHTFEGSSGGILAIIARHQTIYAGCQDGYVQVWDLETKTLMRTIIAQENVDILAMSMIGPELYTCSANGVVQRWSSAFDCTASWKAHDGIILSSVIAGCPTNSGIFTLITGANDNELRLWDIGKLYRESPITNIASVCSLPANFATANDIMMRALAKFVSLPTVSKDPEHRTTCAEAADWLKKCLSQLGAESSLVVETSRTTNPLVLATFRGNQAKPSRPRILFYGHYDVISAPPEGWNTDPFSVTGVNGYLYGRGVTDNKGPILAVACAASNLLQRRSLDIDLVLLIEGEEEAGSGGFKETVTKHKKLIGPIDAILVSNSTWIEDDRPCITYGLRGVVRATVEISREGTDSHSGVDGGAIAEPMVDMVRVLATLAHGDSVLIAGFNDQVRPQSAEEKQLYKLLSEVTKRPADSLALRWREPSLSIHNISVSGPGNATVIPSKVTAQMSIRLVPDQEPEVLSKALCDHVRSSFRRLASTNSLNIIIEDIADWWLGDLTSKWFIALEDAIRQEWGVDPLRIREGGTIPSVPFLEKEFQCPALHLPLGQSSDRAHLPNERIALNNLLRGKSVIERFLRSVSEPSS